jgi:phosphate transport system ATP-binding protein
MSQVLEKSTEAPVMSFPVRTEHRPAATATADEPETVIETKHLNLWYGKQQALYDIHLDIVKNRVTAIIGPSGCGKSTYLKTLNRMAELDASVRITGEIRFQGRNIFEKRFSAEELRTKIGIVFQKPNPFPKSIYENVAYGPRIHGIKKKSILNEIVEKSLRDAALWDEVKDRLHKHAYGLSGGQQQRLCIARTLAIEPEVILMDEPTSALDPISASKIEELINQLKKEYSIVIVTHNLQQAARISDKTAFFLNGRVEEFDDTVTLFSNPKSRRTEDYVSGRFG